MKVILILNMSYPVYQHLKGRDGEVTDEDIEFKIKLHNNTVTTSPIYCKIFPNGLWSRFLHSINGRLP